MAKPLRIVLVRHGQSEANIVQHAQKIGQEIALEKDVESRADWRQRLSPEGVMQAKIAKKELSKIYGNLDFFDTKYISPFIRARETAFLLSRNEKEIWKIDDLLAERLWGIYGRVSVSSRIENFSLTNKFLYNDPFYMRLDGGESLFDVYLRFRKFNEKLEEENSNENVLIVAHKQLIQVACYFTEQLLPEDWNETKNREIYDVPNLGAVEYSRVNPYDARDVRENFTWRRVLDLGDSKRFNNSDWVEFSSKDEFFAGELQIQIEKNEPFLKKSVDIA